MSDDEIQLITMISNDKLSNLGKLFDINLISAVMNWLKMSARTIMKSIIPKSHPPPSHRPQHDGREIENKSRKNAQ
mgnify:CR=1 FL=1